MFCGMLKKSFDPNGSTILRFRVWPTDVDLNIVNNALILTYAEFGRLDYFFRSKLVWYCLKKKIYVVAGAIQVRFHRPLRRFQLIELHTEMVYWDSQWIWVSHKLYQVGRTENKLAASLIVKITFREGKVPRVFDQLLKEVGLTIHPRPKPADLPNL